MKLRLFGLLFLLSVAQTFGTRGFPDSLNIRLAEPINDVRDIANIVSRSPTSQFCMADSYFRFVFGSKSDVSTSGTVKAVADGLKTSGSLAEMLKALGTSKAFIYKTERN